MLVADITQLREPYKDILVTFDYVKRNEGVYIPQGLDHIRMISGGDNRTVFFTDSSLVTKYQNQCFIADDGWKQYKYYSVLCEVTLRVKA